MLKLPSPLRTWIPHEVAWVQCKTRTSTIRDVDVAVETANFAKLSLLAQTGSYALSQANAASSNLTSLLQ